MKWKSLIIVLCFFCLASTSVIAGEDCLTIDQEKYCKTNTTEEPKKIFEMSGISWGFDVDHRLGTPQLQEVKDYIDVWVRLKEMKMNQRRYLAEAWMLE